MAIASVASMVEPALHWVCNGSGGDVFLFVAVDIGCGIFFFFFEVILMGCILKIKYEMLTIL